MEEPGLLAESLNVAGGSWNPRAAPRQRRNRSATVPGQLFNVLGSSKEKTFECCHDADKARQTHLFRDPSSVTLSLGSPYSVPVEKDSYTHAQIASFLVTKCAGVFPTPSNSPILGRD